MIGDISRMLSASESNAMLKSSTKQILQAIGIWGLAALFYFYDNLLQVSPSAMKPELSLAFAKQAKQFGSLSAYCLYAYGLMQIPAGLLMDRFGPRRILTLGCAFCGLGSFLFGLANTLGEANIGRILIGIGAAFAFLGCLKIINQWFAANKFAFFTGLTVTIGFLGVVCGISVLTTLVGTVGWQKSMQGSGLFGLMLSGLLWWVIRDKRLGQATAILPHSDLLPLQTTREIFEGLWQILQQRQTWIAAIYAGLMFIPTLAFGGLWGIPFLVEAQGFDRAVAGNYIALIYLGWMIGCPLWGFISDYYKRRNLPMMIATFLTLMDCVSIIYFQTFSLPMLGYLLFFLGFFSSTFVLAFAVVQESNSSRTASTAIGFTNALNTLGGAIAQPVIGMILDWQSEFLFGNYGERIFNLAQYQRAFFILPLSILIALMLLFLLKETFCQTRKI